MKGLKILFIVIFLLIITLVIVLANYGVIEYIQIRKLNNDSRHLGILPNQYDINKNNTFSKTSIEKFDNIIFRLPWNEYKIRNQNAENAKNSIAYDVGEDYIFSIIKTSQNRKILENSYIKDFKDMSIIELKRSIISITPNESKIFMPKKEAINLKTALLCKKNLLLSIGNCEEVYFIETENLACIQYKKSNSSSILEFQFKDKDEELYMILSNIEQNDLEYILCSITLGT